MTRHPRRIAAVLPLAACLLLASCDTTAPASVPPAEDVTDAPVTDDAGQGGETGQSGAAGQACPTVPQEGFELFSDPVIVSAPEPGAPYGDGSQIAWTFATAPHSNPDLDLFYVNEAGDAIAMGGLVLQDLGGNTWGTSNNVFWSDADGRPGFAILGDLTEGELTGDGGYTGTHLILGVYCLGLIAVD